MKLVSTPNLDHQYQVVRADGLPDVPLTLFASDLLKSLSPSSVPIYMREVLGAFEWAQSDEIVLRNHWSLFGPPAEVRNVLREYLTVAAKCKLTTRADRLGVKVTYVCQTSETGINIRILLAALRRFYDYLISSEGYVHANPLLQEQMDQIRADLRNGYRQAVRAAEGRDPMPSVSGVDPPFGIRLSANFFRCVDREWIPRTIDIMRRVMIEQTIGDVTSIDANDLLFRIHVGEVGKGLTDHQRRTLIGQWSAIRNVYEEYSEKLTAEQLEGISPFFIKPLTDRRKLARHTPWAGVHREQQERVKKKTDAVQQQFYRVRYVAGIRCNQVRRLHTAVTEAIAFVEKKHRTYPHEFSYEETVQTLSGRSVRQRVELTLWDAVSIREHAIGLGYKEAPGTTRQRRWREGRYAAARVPHYVEYNATVSLERNCAAELFWFLELFRHRVFRRVEARVDSDVADKREEFDRKWGYQSCVSWSDEGMLSLGSADYRPLDFLHAQEGHEFLPYEGIHAAAMFGGLMVRMGTITGARGGEVQQIAQSPDCFKQLDNVGPKAATRWVLRMVPKGRKDRADYFIDEDTKNHLVELIRFQCERLGTMLLPVVKSEYGKTPPDRYVLQWNGHGIDLQVLNTLIRFLLHGILFQALDGTVVQLTSHLLRHAFANEMAELKVSVDIIATLLHQRDKTVTKYYSRPTPTQVIRAAEMIFVDRIDVGAEALRSPDEIGRMLKDAEGKLGALTEVFGGTCVVANMCPAKFACVGCAGNAPDPAKRYQIQQKLDWAKEQVGYAVREHLPAEEVKLGQLIADCKLVMEEMDLIEAARADRSQDVTVQHGHNSR